MKLKKLFRAISVDEVRVEKDARIIEFPFASEYPVDRYWGKEIIDCSKSAADLKRLNDGAPLLFNHNMDEVIGVVEKAWMGTDKRGYCRVRFAKTPEADKYLQMVEDKILRNVSYGYRIHEMELTKSGDGIDPEYTVTKFEPYEVSLVSIPADPTVGLDRADEGEEYEPKIRSEERSEGKGAKKMDPIENKPEIKPVDIEAVKAAERAAEKARVAEINALGDKFGKRDLAQSLINGDKSLDEARAAFLAEMSKAQKPVDPNAAVVGLTDKEIRKFSFVKAMNAMANPSDRKAQEAAKFELEVSAAASEKSGKAARGIMVPVDILRAPMSEKRDLVVGTSTAGGNLVSTDLLSGSFIDLLRNKMVVQRLGATFLNGLVGSVAIPRQSGGATAYWVAESGAPTESQQTINQVTMSPKTLGAFTDYSRKLLLQSSIDIETFVRNDLASVIGLAWDYAALYGSGSSNQPQGLKTLSGINTVDLTAAAPTWAELISLETAVASDNADIGTLAYATNALGRGLLKGTVKDSGSGQFLWEQGNTVNGYRCEISNQIATLSSTDPDYFFGNWADMLIGLWSGLDILVDPYTNSTSGTVRMVALQDVDVAFRHPESFCYANKTL